MKRSTDEVIKYPCDKCENAVTTAGSLKRHIEVTHEGVRYPCDKCEYAATTASYQKMPKLSRSRGFRW